MFQCYPQLGDTFYNQLVPINLGEYAIKLADIVQRGWEAVGSVEFDTLVKDYVEGMTFNMPRQGDILEGRQIGRAHV